MIRARVPAAAVVTTMLLLTGCSGSVTIGGAAVSADDVEAQASEEFSAQFPVDSVDCPEDLPAEVDASIKCELVSEGKAFEMTATTTAVDGEDVQFDVELTAEK